MLQALCSILWYMQCELVPMYVHVQGMFQNRCCAPDVCSQGCGTTQGGTSNLWLHQTRKPYSNFLSAKQENVPSIKMDLIFCMHTLGPLTMPLGLIWSIGCHCLLDSFVHK